MTETLPLSIRMCDPSDIPRLYAVCASGGHDVDPVYFETALAEQTDQKRWVFLAFSGDMLAGYAHVNFFPQYAPFLRLAIPEIQDVFVHPDFRRQGVGEALIAACESSVRQRGRDTIGIGVGVSGRFGTAQRLYVRLGYLPDGAGAVFDRIPATSGDVRPIDDRLCLMLIKSL